MLIVRHQPFFTALLLVASWLSSFLYAQAQSGPRIIDTGRLDVAPRAATLETVAMPHGATRTAVPPDVAHQHLILHEIRVVGATVIPASTLARTWQPFIGRRIEVQEIYRIADAIAAAYADAGVALYQVTVPPQSFIGGIAEIRVAIGYVDSVVIQSDVKGASFPRLRRYAAPIIADRPLRQATLERQILLMNQISGLTVGSQFVPVAGRPGAVRLALTVQRRRVELLTGINNQGVSVLGRTELYVGAAINGMLQQGDRTEFVFGFPAAFTHYQYFGLSHSTPIGDDGARLKVNIGDLITRPTGESLSGNATIAGLELSYPLILRTRQTLAGTAQLDLLNSNNALLGTTISDERTRALRIGLSWARTDDWGGVGIINPTLSQGLDLLGARRGGPAFGGPVFTKFNLRIGREQDLPWGLLARIRAAAQYTPAHLPASEEFVYGGALYGQAFYANPLYGDRGLEAYGELARKLPWPDKSPWLSGWELFTFADWGRIWNTHTAFMAVTDHAASAGAGARTKLIGRITLQLLAANALVQPGSVPRAARWSALFTLAGAF